MDRTERKKHWENIYTNKALTDVSWYQPVPETSLEFLKTHNIPKTAAIIDVGGGDSFFADHLLDLGYTNITVLDISEAALERAKQRFGERAGRVKWIVADAASFEPAEKYDFWHDRAAFHFLTEQKEIDAYLQTIDKALNPQGVLVIGTFSEEGPTKCSGINVHQYSAASMTDRLKTWFKKIKCITTEHTTPFKTIQKFVFCSFSKMVTA